MSISDLLIIVLLSTSDFAAITRSKNSASQPIEIICLFAIHVSEIRVTLMSLEPQKCEHRRNFHWFVAIRP